MAETNQARRFDGVDDTLHFSAGNANPSGAFTIAMVVKRNSDYPDHALLAFHTSGGTAGMLLLVRGAAQGGDLWLPGNCTGPTFLSADGWVVIVVTKASGLVKPRAHKRPVGSSSWTHVDFNINLPDQSAGTQIWTDIEAGYFPSIDREAMAWWNTNMNDASVEATFTDTLSNWLAASPAWLVRLDQTDVTATVIDETGNGGNQISRVGTSSVAGNDSFLVDLGPIIPPPNPPTNLTATPRYKKIELNWTDNSTDETTFRVERAIDSSGSPGSYSEIASVNSNITTYSDSDVTIGITYWYRVRSRNNNGDSSYTNAVSASPHIYVTVNWSATAGTFPSGNSVQVNENDILNEVIIVNQPQYLAPNSAQTVTFSATNDAGLTITDTTADIVAPSSKPNSKKYKHKGATIFGLDVLLGSEPKPVGEEAKGFMYGEDVELGNVPRPVNDTINIRHDNGIITTLVDRSIYSPSVAISGPDKPVVREIDLEGT